MKFGPRFSYESAPFIWTDSLNKRSGIDLLDDECNPIQSSSNFDMVATNDAQHSMNAKNIMNILIWFVLYPYIWYLILTYISIHLFTA